MESRTHRLTRFAKQGYVAPPFSKCTDLNYPIHDEQAHQCNKRSEKSEKQISIPADCLNTEPDSSISAAKDRENLLAPSVVLQDHQTYEPDIQPTVEPHTNQSNPTNICAKNNDDQGTEKLELQFSPPADYSSVKTASSIKDAHDSESSLSPSVVLQYYETFEPNMEPTVPHINQSARRMSPSVLQNANEITMETKTACSSSVLDKGCSDGEDFSPNDSGDEFKPIKSKRRRLQSISSNGSSSSDTSSSSSSSSSSSCRTNASTPQPNEQDRNQGCSSENIEASSSPVKKGKRKTRNPHLWKRNLKKVWKNTGKEYKSSSGKTVNSKCMRPPCTDTCRLSCSKNLPEATRKQIFKSYWNLGSLQRQRDFLSSCIMPLVVACRRIRSDAVKPRKPNCGFYFVNDGKNVRVCKTFLMNTLGIAERTVRTVIVAKVSDIGITPQDKRGKHGKQVKIDSEVKESVRLHINSIPRVESHYLRANTSREFIDGGLTIAELYRLYKEVRASANKEAATYDTYARIFNTEFNIAFFYPKKDQCDLCESYKNSDEEGKNKLEQNYQDHLKQKELSRTEKSHDITLCLEPERNLVVAIYDLQAVMPVPLGESSAFFYKSKLNCYNFTISDMKNKTTSCYFWHEGLGNRGAIEIGSCVLKFLQNVAENQPNCDVIFYSDNCCGQQKNRYLMAMYYFVVKTLPINSITHKFLIRGHTQNEGDSAHSIIEKSVKRAKKSGPIYTPDHYVQIIRNAKKTGKPFVVNELNYSDFYDLKTLTEDIGLNTHGTMKISEVKAVRFTDTDIYAYKTGYDKEWTHVECKVTKGRFSNKTNMRDVTLKPAYTTKMSIAEKKKKDLLQLVQTNIVPKFYEGFYKSL